MSYVLICRTDRTDKKHLSEIQFLIHHERNQYRLSIGEKCKPDSWDKVNQRVQSKYKDAPLTNARLRKHKIALESILDAQPRFDIGQIKGLYKSYQKSPETFDPHAQVAQKPLDFHSLIDQLIDSHRNQWSYGHKKKFRSLRTKVLEFDKGFDPLKLSTTWFQNYIDFCQAKGNSHNTIHTDFKVFRQLLSEMAMNGHRVNQHCLPDYPYIEPRIIPLTWEEVKRISSVDLDGLRGTMEDSRYLWLLGAYTGLRWSDLVRVTAKSFSTKQVDDNGTTTTVWYYNSIIQKTKQQLTIPLLDEAVEHLQKRDFTIPNRCQQIVNRDIKEIGKLAKIEETIIKQQVVDGRVTDTQVPKHELIHIHTGRHSYACEIATRTIGRPFADQFVSQMLGHASPATTWKYTNLVLSSKDKMFLAINKKSAQ